MKLLVLASTLDLRYRLGCTPAWWQLLKAFHESGHEVVAIPYLGDPVESPWWSTRRNPCATESKLFERFSRAQNDQFNGRAGFSKGVSKVLIERIIRPKWRRYLFELLGREKDVDGVLMLSVPVNHMSGIPTALRNEFGVKVAAYDGDMPTILPKYARDRGFKFDPYEGADLSEYDAFFSNSKGVLPDLVAMGARNAHPLYWAADPELFAPVVMKQDYDVAFYGHGSQFREAWIENLIARPSELLTSVRFVVGGGGFEVPLGRAQEVGPVPLASFGRFVGRSKINLNTTRYSHTSVYASATSRPFELAAMGACIVSQPYAGIEEWFKVGEELVVVGSMEEAVEAYKRLLADEKERRAMGERARSAILRRHTYRHRAQEVLRVLAWGR